MSYADAVDLLGGRNRVVVALDRMTGGLLLAASAVGVPFAASLFDTKNEMVKLGHELVSASLREIRGLGRFSRTQRISAAHAVVVVSSYFEAVARLPLPATLRTVEFSAREEIILAGGASGTGGHLAEMAAALLHAELPLPTPERPYEENLEQVNAYFRRVSGSVLRFLQGLAAYESLDDSAKAEVAKMLRDDAPGRAVGVYEESFAQLALEVPEMGLWANAIDHQGTRAAVARVTTSLGGVQALVERMAQDRGSDVQREAIHQYHVADLQRPILSAGDAPAGIQIPLLGKAYVDPDFRVAEVTSSHDMVSERWWEQRPVRSDLDAFLIGHLTSVAATRAPLLVLGQPGSGKSVLTRILAARLPSHTYFAVRVALREVPADADVQSHLEYAIRATTGDSVSWPDLVRSCEGAMPVVLLDGFDELLQATGVAQTDYLERVAGFQQREASLGRPLVAVVTSRTAVADRARCAPGSVAVRLEPFRREQVERWLDVWNAANTMALAARGLLPLPSSIALMNPELASQPLLLMMLALYDADDNALQRTAANLGHVELYERLLQRFATREVRKENTGLSDEELPRSVESELLRLSVVAFAMFNRGRQWITEAELNDDLATLLGRHPTRRGSGDGLRAELTAADRVVGRFFFVHQSSASRDGQHLRTFEFLHATFGEYLIGRLVARELSDMAVSRQFHAGFTRHVETDVSFLHALLSFAPLTMRGAAVGFLRDLVLAWPEQQREKARDQVLALFRRALHPMPSDRYAEYTPADLNAPERHAAYSCNLLLLLAMVGDEEVRATELFAGHPWRDFRHHWRNLALLWRSQLPVSGWDGLEDVLRVERLWTNGERDVRIHLAAPQSDPPPLNLRWSYHMELRSPAFEDSLEWVMHRPESIMTDVHFICDWRIDVVAHVSEPFVKYFHDAIVTFRHTPSDGAKSAANSLAELWLASSTDQDVPTLCSLYENCLTMANVLPWRAEEHRANYVMIVLRQLMADAPHLPVAWRRDMVTLIQNLVASTGTPSLEQLWAGLDKLLREP